MGEVLSPQEWERAGRGREIQFFATDEDVAGWLACLPEEFEPYVVVASAGRELVGGRQQVFSLEEFTDALRRRSRLMSYEFALGSARLTVGLESHARSHPLEWLYLSGLLLLQHGLLREGGAQDASRVAMIDRVRSRRSGETRSHSEYRRLFRTLEAAIEADLRFRVVRLLADGGREEHDYQRWTARAADAYARGVQFYRARPGTPISDG